MPRLPVSLIHIAANPARLGQLRRLSSIHAANRPHVFFLGSVGAIIC